MGSVDYQVASSGNDGVWYYFGGTWYFGTTGTQLSFGTTALNYPENCYARWTGVTIPVGATITAANLSFYATTNAGSLSGTKIYLEKASNPTACTGAADANSRARTTAYALAVQSSEGWFDVSITDLISELQSAYNYSGGAAIQMIAINGGEAADNFQFIRSYDYSGNIYGPKLHIEYTVPSSGNPHYYYAQMM